MKQISLLLLLSGIFCCASCTPEEEVVGSSQNPEPVIETEAAPKEAPVEPMPVAAELEKVEAPKSQNPMVKIVTTKGEIDIELYADKAPITVANFLAYTKSGFYNGTIFHRVIKGFMIQGGGFLSNMQQKPTNAPIKNESYNQLRNERGTIAMARTNAPDSATSQFFINHVNNRPLDFDGSYKPGYAVFGKVVKGMKVVDAIAEIPTKRAGGHGNVPVETVTIESVTILE